MRFVSVQKLQKDDIIAVPRFNEFKQPGIPGAFDLYKVIKVEVGNRAIGFELRISSTNLVSGELTPLRITAGGFVFAPDATEIVLPS
jgi:hypothetical protein